MNRYLFLAPALAALALSSCAKVQNAEAPITTPSEGITATIQKPLPAEGFGEGTKALYHTGENDFLFKFLSSDHFLIAKSDASSATSMNYSVKVDGTDAKKCVVSIDDFLPVDGTYGALYPLRDGLAVSDPSNITFSLAGQTQSSNDNMDHLADYDCNVAQAVITSCKGNFELSRKVSWVKFVLTFPETETVQSIKLVGHTNQFASKLTINVPEGSATPVYDSDEITLGITDGTLTSNIYTAYLTLAGGTDLANFCLVVKTNKNQYLEEYTSNTARVLDAGKYAVITKSFAKKTANATASNVFSGGNVVLGSDLTVTSKSTLSNNSVIDLNGYTLSLSYNTDDSNVLTVNNATVTIQNGKISATSANEGASLILFGKGTTGYLKNVEITSRCNSVWASSKVSYDEKKGTCTLSDPLTTLYIEPGCRITSTHTSGNYQTPVAISYNANVYVNGGVLKGNNYSFRVTTSGGSIYLNSGVINKGEVEVNNEFDCIYMEGRNHSYQWNAWPVNIYIPSNSSVVIKGIINGVVTSNTNTLNVGWSSLPSGCTVSNVQTVNYNWSN